MVLQKESSPLVGGRTRGSRNGGEGKKEQRVTVATRSLARQAPTAHRTLPERRDRDRASTIRVNERRIASRDEDSRDSRVRYTRRDNPRHGGQVERISSWRWSVSDDATVSHRLSP